MQKQRNLVMITPRRRSMGRCLIIMITLRRRSMGRPRRRGMGRPRRRTIGLPHRRSMGRLGRLLIFMIPTMIITIGITITGLKNR